MLSIKEVCKTDMEFGDLVHEKWQSEAYGLKACKINYSVDLIEELKLKKFLKEINFCCDGNC